MSSKNSIDLEEIKIIINNNENTSKNRNIYSLSNEEIDLLPNNQHIGFRKIYQQLRSLVNECRSNMNCDEEEMEYLKRRLFSSISTYLQLYNKSKTSNFQFENVNTPTSKQIELLVSMKNKLENSIKRRNSRENVEIRNRSNVEITLENTINTINYNMIYQDLHNTGLYNSPNSNNITLSNYMKKEINTAPINRFISICRILLADKKITIDKLKNIRKMIVYYINKNNIIDNKLTPFIKAIDNYIIHFQR
jgi:hypothetical protein